MVNRITFALLAVVTLLVAIFAFHEYTTLRQPSLVSLFPLQHYSQNIGDWINPMAADYDKPLLSTTMQQTRLERYFKHYYGSASPWNAEYINELLLQDGDSMKSIELSLLNDFNNQDKAENEIGYAENFHPYPPSWIKQIAANMDTTALNHLSYQAARRAIATNNLNGRVLPTNDVYFYSHQLAGQGYPFDNLQISALWAGTPLYILAQSKDHAWLLVISPDFIGWVEASGVAYVNEAFVTAFEAAAKKNIAAIIKTKTGIIAKDHTFLFNAYVGTVLPAKMNGNTIQLLVPAANAERQAVLKYADVTTDEAAMMPLTLTKHHLANIMQTLINRPYGWGGMYFYNDCSAELKNLFTPFGIWLPRHSSDQMTVSKMVDMTSATPEERLNYLIHNGKPFLTQIYIGGHIVLYIGNYLNPNDHSTMAMTYQDMWGLSPTPPNRRAVIGQSVLFPMLLQFPEDASLTSQAAKHYFQIAFLDQMPNEVSGLSHEMIDVKALMMPDI